MSFVCLMISSSCTTHLFSSTGQVLHIWACFLMADEFLPWRLLLSPDVWRFLGSPVQLSIHFRWCWWQTRDVIPPKLRLVKPWVCWSCLQDHAWLTGSSFAGIPSWKSSQKLIQGASCPACRHLFQRVSCSLGIVYCLYNLARGLLNLPIVLEIAALYVSASPVTPEFSWLLTTSLFLPVGNVSILKK